METPDPTIWREMFSYLRRHHGSIWRHWFDQLEPVDLSGGRLTIRARNAIQRNYLVQMCAGPFQEAAQTATGALVTVGFTSPDQEPASHASAERADDGKRIADSLGDDEFVFLSPDHTFDNFITGPGNQLAYAAAVAVAQQPGEAYNPLFIHGGVGLGKTHLLQAIGQTIHLHNPEARICYLSCDAFMHHFLEAVQNGDMQAFRHRYRHVDLLLIDDIHFLSNRERTQEEFFHTFNTLYQAGKQIVLSSDSSPNEIPQLEERIVSRFNWGLVAGIDSPAYETRIAIIQHKARLRGLHVPNDAVCYVASMVDSNTRELEGALTKVQSVASIRGADIDLSIAKQALGEEAQTPLTPHTTIHDIINRVTRFYGLKVTELLSKRRHRSVSVPRHVCMYLARRCTRHSLEEIGSHFGGRDHTTVMHATRAVSDRMATDPAFADQVQQLEAELKKRS